MSSSEPFLHHFHLFADQSLSARANSDGISPDATVWQHLDLNSEHAEQWLHDRSQLDSITIQSIAAAETRPRSFASKNGLLIVLRGLNTNPGGDPADMVSIRVWLENKRIISARLRPLLAIKDIVDSIGESRGPRSSGEFLTTLVELLADRIGDFVNRIEDEMGQAEDDLEVIAPEELRAALGSLRRQIASVRRFLAPQRDALDRLYHLESEILSLRDKQRLREESDRISRYLEDLDLARERAVVLQEAFLSQLAQEQNTRMYVLSIVAAIFLPLTFVTGLLGMNVGGLPGVENARGFAIATAIMLGATLVVVGIFKWRKWI